jgi:hypothetical protein
MHRDDNGGYGKLTDRTVTKLVCASCVVRSPRHECVRRVAEEEV